MKVLRNPDLIPMHNVTTARLKVDQA